MNITKKVLIFTALAMCLTCTVDVKGAWSNITDKIKEIQEHTIMFQVAPIDSKTYYTGYIIIRVGDKRKATGWPSNKKPPSILFDISDLDAEIKINIRFEGYHHPRPGQTRTDFTYDKLEKTFTILPQNAKCSIIRIIENEMTLESYPEKCPN